MFTQAANPVIPDTEIARAESEKELLCLRRNIILVKKTDELDTAIHSTFEYCLEISLNDEDQLMPSEGVEDIIEQIPNIENILVPGFFSRITFPLRLLRQTIFPNGLGSVDSEFPALFKLPDRDLNNTGIKEKLWFLLFLGAEVQQIQDVFSKHRQFKSQTEAMLALGGTQDPSNSRSSAPVSPPDMKNDIQTEDVSQVNSARAQGIQDARANIQPISHDQQQTQFGNRDLVCTHQVTSLELRPPVHLGAVNRIPTTTIAHSRT